MNWNQALFPSLKRRGGCAIKKMSRSNLSSRRRGGAKRKPDRAQPQGKIGEIFRPEEFRRTDHPVCGASEASRLFINAAATPPFQGGECVRTETVCQFIHTFRLALFHARLVDRSRSTSLTQRNGCALSQTSLVGYCLASSPFVNVVVRDRGDLDL